MNERNRALEDVAVMLDDMAKDWSITAGRHARVDARQDASRVAHTYAKAAAKVREMKREGD